MGKKCKFGTRVPISNNWTYFPGSNCTTGDAQRVEIMC